MMLPNLKRLDLIFGRPVYLTYAEKTKFKTVLGALSTIFLVTAVSTFTIHGFLQLHTGKILSISNEEVKYTGNTSFIPSELGFNMTFGFNVDPLSARIGHFTVTHVTQGRNSDGS